MLYFLYKLGKSVGLYFFTFMLMASHGFGIFAAVGITLALSVGISLVFDSIFTFMGARLNSSGHSWLGVADVVMVIAAGFNYGFLNVLAVAIVNFLVRSVISVGVHVLISVSESEQEIIEGVNLPSTLLQQEELVIENKMSLEHDSPVKKSDGISKRYSEYSKKNERYFSDFFSAKVDKIDDENESDQSVSLSK